MKDFKTLNEAYDQVLTNEGWFDRAKAQGSKFVGGAKQLGQNVGSVAKAGMKGISGDANAAKAELSNVKSIGQAGQKAAGQSLVKGAKRDLKSSVSRAIGALNDANARFSEFIADQQKTNTNVNPQVAQRMANVQTKVEAAIQALQDASRIVY